MKTFLPGDSLPAYRKGVAKLAEAIRRSGGDVAGPLGDHAADIAGAVLGRGKQDEAWLVARLREAEAGSTKPVLPGDVLSLEGEARRTAVQDALSKRAIDHVFGRLADAKVPADLLPLFRAVKKTARSALRVAVEKGRSESWPLIRLNPGGGAWTVHESGSGIEVGRADSIEDAVRLGQERFTGMAEADAEEIARLATMMEGALASTSRDGAARQTTFEFLPGIRMDEGRMAKRSAGDAVSVRSRLIGLEHSLGIREGFAAQIFGESRTRFEVRQRHTINRIYADGTIATVFHEDFHGFRREARASGRITRQDEIAFLRMLDGVMADKADKSGRPIRFLPEGIADKDLTDLQIDEAMSELAEAEILRTRRPNKSGAMAVPPGLVTRHMKALGVANPRVAGKFKAFFEAVRGYFGLALRRAAVLEKGFRDGTLDRAITWEMGMWISRGSKKDGTRRRLVRRRMRGGG